MKKKLLIAALFSTLFINKLYACGEYKAHALVVMKNGESMLVINPETKSEINLKVAFDQLGKLSPYIGRTIETKIVISKMDYTRGFVKSMGEIKVILTDPLSQTKSTKLELILKKACVK
jgi:hypothetical protein